MRANLIVVDDFYCNPDETRKFALSQEFDVKGNFPGCRTKDFLKDDVKNCIQEFVSHIQENSLVFQIFIQEVFK